MMKIKKNFSFTNKRTIWRLIPSDEKLLIEERDEVNKQVYFNCVIVESGKSVLKDFQLEEKFWVGVEAFENNKIYFHGFFKPDMPGHAGIYAFDLNSKKLLWERKNPVFLFLYNKQVYAFNQKFESRDYFSFNSETGELVKELGEDSREINEIRERLQGELYEKYKDFYFPESFTNGKLPTESEKLINGIKSNKVVSGSIEYIKYKDLLLLGFHTIGDDAKLDNNFNIIDIGSGKIIFEQILNTGITSYIPESFFVKDNLLFTIKNKSELIVYGLTGD
jgi:Domain of unknown function (DUF4905)